MPINCIIPFAILYWHTKQNFGKYMMHPENTVLHWTRFQHNFKCTEIISIIIHYYQLQIKSCILKYNNFCKQLRNTVTTT
jgi:hypothetical protein